jgi:hypothetical protein
VGEEEVEGFDLGVSGADGELLAGVVDEEVGVAPGVAGRLIFACYEEVLAGR